MILVAKQPKPFSFTAKGTCRRQATLKDYADEIDELYKSVDEIAQRDIVPPLTWTAEESVAFVRRVVSSIMERPLGDEDDMFVHGCDRFALSLVFSVHKVHLISLLSLQATWIRNTLLNALRSAPGVDIRDIPVNFVYSYPTVTALASLLSQTTGLKKEPSSTNNGATSVDAMLAMVAKYTNDFAIHVPSALTGSFSDELGAVVVLTGSTGGLGCALLWKLLEDQQVSKVYALNRIGSGDLLERHIKAFSIRGLDTGLLSSSKLVMLEADFGSNRLGLEDDVYAKVKVLRCSNSSFLN